jgi:hypothetical protein
MPGLPGLPGRGRAPVPVGFLQRMQHAYGNRAVVGLLRGRAVAPFPGQVVVQRQEAGCEACRKLMTDDDWTVKEAAGKAGYDTSSYYRDTAAKIIEAAEKRGVAFDRALYLAAQARAEQSETDPKSTGFRRFNIQVSTQVVKETQGSFTVTPPAVVHTTKDGRKYRWLETVEQGAACTAIKSPVKEDGFCHPAAPFYFYESMEEATFHYLDAMEKGPFGAKGAKAILWNEGDAGKKGGILEFGAALKRGGYGTDLNYVPKLCDSYNTVVKRVRVALQKALDTKRACKTSNEEKIKEIGGDDGNGGKFGEARKALEEIRRKRDQDTSPRRVDVGMTVEEAAALKEVRRWEGELADRKAELQKVEEMIKTLEDRLKGLPEAPITCPPEVKVPGKAGKA